MIVTHKIPYKDGELRIGWASWDDGSLTDRSIKYAYKDASGKISRGAPELPFDILIDMMELAASQGELGLGRMARKQTPVKTTSKEELAEERQALKAALLLLQKLIADLPWADFKAVYDQICSRFEAVKAELARRSDGNGSS